MMKVYAKELPATADPQGVLAALPVIRHGPPGRRSRGSAARFPPSNSPP